MDKSKSNFKKFLDTLSPLKDQSIDYEEYKQRYNNSKILSWIWKQLSRLSPS